MALLKKQADLLKGSFYILEEPTSAPQRYLLGVMSEKKLEKSAKSGRFHTYDLRGSEELEAPCLRLNRDELLDHLSGNSFDEGVYDLNLGPSEKNSYSNLFADTKKLMKETDLEKAVLYTAVVEEAKEFISLNSFLGFVKKGLNNKKSGYLFAYYNKRKETALLGCTPEYIVRTNDRGSLVTTAVAGTKTRSECDVKWSEKLLKEHELVMQGVSNSLQNQVKWGEVYNYQYADLNHLRAEGEVYSKDSVDTVSCKLHPTPAIGCLPKGFLVDKLGPEARGFFGGYVECLSFERPFSLVTIRCFEWSQKRVQVCIGGGVLEESVFETEWKELEQKLKTFKKLWGL